MAINKRLLTIAILLCSMMNAFSGNGINSPYSRYGLGILSDQSLGVNRQMSGLGYGLRSGSYINLLNPASFSQADTLTMLLETGFSLQNVNFEEGKVKRNAHNASFDYIAMQFRAFKNIGISFGYLPYSNVGYSFSSTLTDGGKERTDSYEGSGGIYQPFVGIGWSPVKNLSVGLMASYIYGDISHIVSHNFTDANITDETRNYTTEIRSYKMDLGVQYTTILKEKHKLTVGAIYSLGHDMNADAKMITITGQADTVNISGGFKLPHTIGVGVWYDYKNNWEVGLDYTFQNWSSADFFGYDKGVNRSKIAIGAEYYPNKIMSRNLLKRMHYRIGAYYSQPYTEVNGTKGCEEYGLSAGFSFPVINKINNRSVLHISGQVIRMEPKTAGLISETYLRLNIGITFNENWFMKMKLR